VPATGRRCRECLGLPRPRRRYSGDAGRGGGTDRGPRDRVGLGGLQFPDRELVRSDALGL